MKSKKEYIILIAVAAVLALYLVFHQSDRTLYELPEMADISEKEITKIELKTPDETVQLEKQAGKWVIKPQGYPAADAKIEKMIDTIQDFELTALVSESQNYARYQLTDDGKIIVKAWADGELARAFAIGKAAPSHRHTFVKLPDDPNVYHASNNFRSKFNQSLDDLRDKAVLALNAEEIQTIEIQNKDDQLTIGRTQPQPEVTASPDDADAAAEMPEETTPKKPLWQDAQGNDMAESDVEDLLDTLSNLKCQSFIDDKQKSDFSDPIYTVTLTGPETHTLFIFDKVTEDGEKYPAVASGSNYPFYLSSHKAKNIMEAFKKE